MFQMKPLVINQNLLGERLIVGLAEEMSLRHHPKLNAKHQSSKKKGVPICNGAMCD